MEKATNKKKKVQLCAVMSTKMYEQIQEESKKQMISMSGLTRQIISNYLSCGGA